jgi:hypothetical protein
MRFPDKIWQRLISAARKATRNPAPPITAQEVQSFSSRTVNAWKRSRARAAEPDPLRLWERVGMWSVGAAAAALALILILHRAPSPDPFEPFGPERTDEATLFASIL